ncbi:ubiquinol oxidase subunit II [Buchnera aphidicola (Ceratoglyphina bambusae)]|uniref:ubiquinol oxidase subunit II n=1 Tax=Buchnera aphidicola TaxID=9 RepID=UPI0031B85AF2
MKKRINTILFIFIAFFIFVYSKSYAIESFSSYGIIRKEQNNLMLISFFAMLIIVIPVIFMTLFFAYKYNENNSNKSYDPNWNNSIYIEMIIWIVPIVIIFFLSVLSFNSTRNLDTNKRINGYNKTMQINAISLDWCWLFIYPDEHIASINEVSFPVNTPVKFNLTSNSVMNSFFIPSLGSQIYTMAGAKTKLYLIANHKGIYKGLSSNYSGNGFSGMKFSVIVCDNIQFIDWINKIKKSKNYLDDISKFNVLQIPESNRKIEYFSNVYPNLFYNIINKFNNN